LVGDGEFVQPAILLGWDTDGTQHAAGVVVGVSFEEIIAVCIADVKKRV
jgi:hypothetical protein